VILLALAALAAEALPPLPEKPAPPEPVDGDCARVLPFAPGKPPPPGVLDPQGRATCSGLIVPSAEYADLLRLEVWGEAVHARYRVDVATLEAEAEAAAEREEWYRQRYAELSERPPVHPSVWFGAGVVGGVVVTVASAYAVSLVAQ
jgi:hypothetical protein